jgi:hypothetical protein
MCASEEWGGNAPLAGTSLTSFSTFFRQSQRWQTLVPLPLRLCARMFSPSNHGCMFPRSEVSSASVALHTSQETAANARARNKRSMAKNTKIRGAGELCFG